MKRYYFSNGYDKNGPFSLEELKMKGINSKTLIWHEGLESWKEAGSVYELREFFELSPPPIVPEINSARNASAHNYEDRNQTASSTHIKAKVQPTFINPFSFKGRIRRVEYGVSLIIYFFILFFLNLMSMTSDHALFGLVYIPLLWFLYAQGAKRCHDLGNSGWWQIIPFYIFWLLFQDGQTGVNKYGNNPKGRI